MVFCRKDIIPNPFGSLKITEAFLGKLMKFCLKLFEKESKSRKNLLTLSLSYVCFVGAEYNKHAVKT